MEKIFKEREVEIQLKNYFQYMEKFYGEEFAIKTTLTNYSIQQALSFFSKRFDNFEDSDIYSALLRRCILCNGNNVYVEHANDLIAENRIEELLEDIEVDYLLKQGLVMNFLNSASLTEEQLYERLKQRKGFDSSAENLKKIDEYFSHIKEKKKPKAKLKTSLNK